MDNTKGRSSRPTAEPSAAKRRALAAATTLPPKERMQAVTLKLPVAYIMILNNESARLRLKRGAFLTLLLQRKLKEVQLERAKDMPGYEFSEAELTTPKLWIWYMTPETRALVDKDRIRMGLNTIGNWVTQTLNHWIGCPEGLQAK